MFLRRLIILGPKRDLRPCVRLPRSKTHNLAGARLGFCIARPELIADMNRVKFSYSPYNLNSMTQAAGVAACVTV